MGRARTLTKTHRTAKLGRGKGSNGRTRTKRAHTKTRTGGKKKSKSCTKSCRNRGGGLSSMLGFDSCCNSKNDCHGTCSFFAPNVSGTPMQKMRCPGYNGVCSATMH